MKTILFLTVVAFASEELIAQSAGWQVVLSHGDTLAGTMLMAVKDDSLLVDHHGKKTSIALNDLVKIQRKESAYGWGAMVGGLAGVGVGISTTEWPLSQSQNVMAKFFETLVSPLVYAGEVVVYVIAGAAVGLVIGFPFQVTEEHDLNQMPIDEIKALLKKIID